MTQIDDLAKLIALDVGEKRVGIALASYNTKLAKPLVTLANDSEFMKRLSNIINDQSVHTVVVGLPRGLEGQDTDQTNYVRQFATSLTKELKVEIVFQDEALTSVKAEEELNSRPTMYEKSDIDKLAACYILEDYINEQLV